MIRKKQIIAALSIVTIAFLLGTITMTVQGGGWREYMELWEAIHRIQEVLETRMPKKGYVSVPAAAFNPLWNNYDTMNGGDTIYHHETTWVPFYASVQLPDGATITRFTIYWKDEGGERIECRLFESNQKNSYVIANAESPGTSGPGWGSSDGDILFSCTVDNSQYAYFLAVIFPPYTSGVDYDFNYAVIEYQYPA